MGFTRATIIFFATLFSCYSQASFVTPVEIISKQDLTNLRFVSKDSSFTYFQKSSGGLFFSTNYSVKKVLDSNPYAQFKVTTSKVKKKVLITRHNFFHQYYGPNIEKDIYLSNYNEVKTEFLAKGTNPKMHLNDEWVSFYRPSVKKIGLKKITLPTKYIEVELNNKIDSFFSPEVESPSENILLYTDLNTKGQQGLLYLNTKKEKSILIYRENSPGKFIEICLKKNNLYVGVFSNSGSKSGSKIFEVPSININPNEKVTMNKIYESELNDIGQINCQYKEDELLFIKNYGDNFSTKYDVASLNLKTKKTTQITNVRYVSSIYEVDGRMMLSYNGKQYLLYGQRSLKQDQLPSDTVKTKNKMDTKK